MRNGFTFIEVLISVVIISVVILSLTDIFSSNKKLILYINSKTISTFNSSLFINEYLEIYNKSKKSAYDILHNRYDFKNDELRNYLKSLEKNITIEDIQKVESDYGFDYVTQTTILSDRVKNSYFKISSKSISLNSKSMLKKLKKLNEENNLENGKNE